QIGIEVRRLTMILKLIQENDLIYKKADTLDKSTVRIFLTEEGVRLKIMSVNTINEFNARVRKALTQEELESFFKVFEKINRVIVDFQHDAIASSNEERAAKEDLSYGQ